jgi:hypothetical protein
MTYLEWSRWLENKKKREERKEVIKESIKGIVLFVLIYVYVVFIFTICN